jgi:hypothetical protein
MDKRSMGIAGVVSGAPPGTVEVCARTNLTKPECSCRLCCRSLVARYAPQLASGPVRPIGAVSRRRG